MITVTDHKISVELEAELDSPHRRWGSPWKAYCSCGGWTADGNEQHVRGAGAKHVQRIWESRNGVHA